MGYEFSKESINSLLGKLSEEYLIYAPKLMVDDGTFSDTDTVRYGKISKIEEVVFDKKSDYSFKEVLLPLSETLFYFTEDSVKEADAPKKGAIVFLRSCDMQAVKRLDQIYLKNGFEDYYYNRLRERIKFILIGCKESFENCFCVDMNSNETHAYDASLEPHGENFLSDCKFDQWQSLFASYSQNQPDVKPGSVSQTQVKVNIPKDLSAKVAQSHMWDEYDSRCIACGRCNFVCPTCTCFTMQDIFYTDNAKVGERRRVQASCMVDGYSTVAGGESYRKKNGERMRFKVLHKVLDFKQRFGYHMCVGCGRCDDVCPEYISFSNCINKLETAVEEVRRNEK